jgi:hypothetical protein
MFKDISENRVVYEIMWKNMVHRTVCSITKAINTRSDYVILIVFHCNDGCVNASQCCMIRTLPVRHELAKFIFTCDIPL